MNRAFVTVCTIVLTGYLCAGLSPAQTPAKQSSESTNELWTIGWKQCSPRDEIRPKFSTADSSGPSTDPCLIIQHDSRMNLDGYFEKSFRVTGGEHYQFRIQRKLINVAFPRRSALIRILWHDDQGRMVNADVPNEQLQELGHAPSAEPEYPADGPVDADGWCQIDNVYRAPSKAKSATIELHLQWAPDGSALWSNFSFTNSPPLPKRLVRLATIHYKPSGKSTRANCEEFAPLIEMASEQNADLIVLGETVPSVQIQRPIDELAEPIPGPTTEYFSALSKKHKTHIVLSLHERDGHSIYNTAVLLDPNGDCLGKYRKVSLPPSEAASGIAPGNEFPVFQTRFGKVGMMVCYDGFFPEVARELSNRGAEVIAWPVWGCNQLLAKARACENHVYLISSTFMDTKDNWMISAVFDPTGKPIATASQWGSVAVAEVDLNRPYIGPYNLGDFRAMLPRHRPISSPEPNQSHSNSPRND